jgi:tetrahydromethanopterin S-methyltransferase subunit G
MNGASMVRDGKRQDVGEQTRKLMSEEFTKSQAYALVGFVQQQILDYCHTKVDQRIFENYVKERFDEITGRLDGHDYRFDRIESRLDKLEARVSNLESQLTEVLSIVSLIAKKLDVMPST